MPRIQYGVPTDSPRTPEHSAAGRARRTWARALLAVAAGAAALALAQWALRRGPKDGVDAAPPGRPLPAAAVPLEDPEGIRRKREAVVEIEGKAAASLAETGAPHMSNPQAPAVRTTARQSVEEVVHDIGNYWTGRGLLGYEGSAPGHPTGELRYPLSSNGKVRRLIQAGRRDPQRVGELLIAKVEAVVPHYHNTHWLGTLRDDKVCALPGGWRKHATYQLVMDDPKSDFPQIRLDEIELAVVNSLYVLANIQYRPGLRAVAAVAGMDSPRACKYPGFLVYVVDSFLSRYPEGEVPPQARHYLEEHRELLKGATPSGRMARVSRRNSPLDTPDMTIEIEVVPADIDDKLTKADMEAILDNFLRFHAALPSSTHPR